jgi:hypothetical protein
MSTVPAAIASVPAATPAPSKSAPALHLPVKIGELETLALGEQQSGGLVQRVTRLEQEVLDKAQKGASLVDRVAELAAGLGL